MRLTVAELSKWLSEVDGDGIVTISDCGEFINAPGMSIWVGDDEPLLPAGVEIVEE